MLGLVFHSTPLLPPPPPPPPIHGVFGSHSLDLRRRGRGRGGGGGGGVVLPCFTSSLGFPPHAAAAAAAVGINGTCAHSRGALKVKDLFHFLSLPPMTDRQTLEALALMYVSKHKM